MAFACRFWVLDERVGCMDAGSGLSSFDGVYGG
jgi:hypothetical protein